MSVPKNTRRVPRLAKLIVAIIIVAGGGIAGVGMIRMPAGPEQGGEIFGHTALTPTTRPTVIRVATFNIHSCLSEEGVSNPDKTAKTLEGFDLAGLQEVRGAIVSRPQAELLGDKLGLQWLFAPTERRFWNDDFGNALLTRLPVSHWQRLPLPSLGESASRNVLIVHFRQPELTVLICHIARHDDQQGQLKVVAELFRKQTPPVILMGDLNATSTQPVLEELLADSSVGNPLDQFIPENRGNHIDWILTRGLTLRNAGTRDLKASDHPLAWAELALPEPANPSSNP